ncbi:MAG: class I SAM-dependent methyltransferase [Planctomycetes bacterium]|nr:class I SAM-dependent methyltransferase [Planctomycetota bacterium]
MYGLSVQDNGRPHDWGRTSKDYATHRPGPPEGLYDRLQALGFGKIGDTLLDLGTGTGIIARNWAKRGLVCFGVDESANQITEARRLAISDGLEIDFRTVRAEDAEFPRAAFDLITANQCFLYFDKSALIPKICDWLRPQGVLATSHFSWLPGVSEIARKTEELVLKHNPSWSSAGFTGEIPSMPHWALGSFRLRAMFIFDEEIPFTRESWRGRIRACRGVGASMTTDEAERFDEEHARLLESIAPEKFTVLHRIDAHVFEPLKAQVH